MKPEDLIKDVGTFVAFLLIFSPGFVSMKSFDFWSSAEPRKAAEYLYEILGYSSVTYALLSPYLFWVIAQSNWQRKYNLLAASAFLCLVVAPAILGSIVALIQYCLVTRTGRTFVGSTKTAWDWTFKTVGEAGLVIEMLDGGEVVGSYTRSAGVSACPYDPAIYIDRLWSRDASGNFKNPIAGSKGQYIDGKQIRSIQFYDLPS